MLPKGTKRLQIVFTGSHGDAKLLEFTNTHQPLLCLIAEEARCDHRNEIGGRSDP